MSVVDNILGFFGLHQLADESRHVRRTLLEEPPDAHVDSEGGVTASYGNASERRELSKKYSRRALSITHQPSYEQPTAEVDNLKERFSAKRYVEHLRDAMDANGKPVKGRHEWLNYINGLSQDDARLFFADVDELITGGELVAVLTPDQELEKRQGVLDKWDEYNERQLGLMTSYGVDSALMHKMLAPTLDASGEAFALNPVPEDADAAAEEALDAMDDAEVEAWAAEEADVGSPPAEHDWDDGEYVDGELQAHCRRCGHLMRASDEDVPRFCLELDTWDVLPAPEELNAVNTEGEET